MNRVDFKNLTMADTEKEIPPNSSAVDPFRKFLSLNCTIYIMLAMVLLALGILWIWMFCANRLLPQRRHMRVQRVYKIQETVPLRKVKAIEGDNNV